MANDKIDGREAPPVEPTRFRKDIQDRAKEDRKKATMKPEELGLAPDSDEDNKQNEDH